MDEIVKLLHQNYPIRHVAEQLGVSRHLVEKILREVGRVNEDPPPLPPSPCPVHGIPRLWMRRGGSGRIKGTGVGYRIYCKKCSTMRSYMAARNRVPKYQIRPLTEDEITELYDDRTYDDDPRLAG